MDFAPLLGYLSYAKMVSSDVFLGSVQFGQESFYSPIEMNFSIASFEADLETINAKSTGTQTVKGTLPVATQVPTGTGHHNLASAPRGSPLDVGLGIACVAFLLLIGFVIVLC
jgi:hypothetical protein